MRTTCIVAAALVGGFLSAAAAPPVHADLSEDWVAAVCSPGTFLTDTSCQPHSTARCAGRR